MSWITNAVRKLYNILRLYTVIFLNDYKPQREMLQFPAWIIFIISNNRFIKLCI